MKLTGVTLMRNGVKMKGLKIGFPQLIILNYMKVIIILQYHTRIESVGVSPLTILCVTDIRTVK